MLQSALRLSTFDHKQVFEKGRLFHTEKATLRLLSIKERGFSAYKWAVNVPKKAAASAVDRNRIRRQTYEAIKELSSRLVPLPPTSEHHGVIIWKPGILKASYESIKKDTEGILFKAGVITKRG